MRLDDRLALEELLIRYARALDADGADSEAEFLAIFTEDITIDSPFAGVFQGGEGIRAWVKQAREKGSKAVRRHCVTNVEVTGSGSAAHVRAHFIQYNTARVPRGTSPVTKLLHTGQFDCDARKVAGAWRLATRVVRTDPER